MTLHARKPCLLAIGVMSHPSPLTAERRRQSVRETWAAHIGDHTVLRFVVGAADWKRQHDSSLQRHDLLPLPHLGKEDEGRLYVFRLFAFLVEALTKFQPRWLMKTDDDAFVRPDRILRDVLRLEVSKKTNVIYGALEWQVCAGPAPLAACLPSSRSSRCTPWAVICTFGGRLRRVRLRVWSG